MAVQETDGKQTAMRIDMNSDMGESFGRWTLGDDEALLEWFPARTWRAASMRATRPSC